MTCSLAAAAPGRRTRAAASIRCVLAVLRPGRYLRRPSRAAAGPRLPTPTSIAEARLDGTDRETFIASSRADCLRILFWVSGLHMLILGGGQGHVCLFPLHAQRGFVHLGKMPQTVRLEMQECTSLRVFFSWGN